MFADRPHTLIINRSDSRCGHCGRGANPAEQRHVSVPGYVQGVDGCGVRWVFVTSDYVMDGLNERIIEMRPDLEPDFIQVTRF